MGKIPTAVDWFAKQVLSARQLGFISNEKFNELLEQAKKMEKEQLSDSWYAGDEDGPIHDFEDYYQETFKKD